MKTEVIEAYLTVNSPYALLGAPTLRRLSETYATPVTLRLIKAADVFGPTGTLPLPQRPPARQAYRLVELRRWAKRRDMALTLHPKAFPIAERPAQGAILAGMAAGLDGLALAEAVGRALWIDDADPGESADLAKALAAGGAPDPDALIAAGADPAYDAELAANADAALAAGAFGFPWYVFRGEPYWGQDRLDFLEDALRAPAA